MFISSTIYIQASYLSSNNKDSNRALKIVFLIRILKQWFLFYLFDNMAVKQNFTRQTFRVILIKINVKKNEMNENLQGAQKQTNRETLRL